MQQEIGQSRLLPVSNRLSRLPWWAMLAVLLGILIFWQMSTQTTYQDIFRAITDGVMVTIYVTLVAYTLATLLGLGLALARLSKNPFIFHSATFFVEIVRGVPILVLLLYVAFVAAPESIIALNNVGGWLAENKILPDFAAQLIKLRSRDISDTARVIAALVIAYSAFISEIFRAGIQSIDKGQMEAARSLGMTYWQAMRYIILPQAIRNVLPPLGNDFIAMLKDSSLVSVLGVRDITGQGRVYIAGTFRAFETYNVMAMLYLTMTLLLSMVVRWVERWVNNEPSTGEMLVRFGVRVFRSVFRFGR